MGTRACHRSRTATMRRGEMLSRRATTAVGLTAAVSLVLVIRLRLSAPDGVAGIGLYAFVAHGALVGSSLALCASWAHARGYRALDRFGYARLVGSRVSSDGVLPDRAGPPGATWNGSRWVVEERAPMSGVFGAGGYQGAESAEETLRREARERAEAEHWARVEREDEAREERRRREKKERKASKQSGDDDDKRERRRDNKQKAASDRASASDAKWADFEKRWAALEDSQNTSSSLTYDDVPWPPKMTELLVRTAKGAGRESREFKVAYRGLMMRWHPDKFAARHGPRLLENDREKVLARVNAVARALNVAFAEG